MAAWARDFADYPELSVSVNLSAKHFSQPNLARKVSEILEETGVEARRLKLEITESVIIDNSEAARAAFDELRQLGVELHIDDFGTGYSSLSYLDRYPIDSVKIDRSLVARIGPTGEGGEIVNTVVKLACAELLHAALECLQATRQMAHRGPGPRGHRNEQKHQHHQGAHATLPCRGHKGHGRRPRRRPARSTHPRSVRPTQALAQQAGPRHPKGAAVVQRNRKPARTLFGLPAQERLGRRDSLTSRAVQCEWNAQALGPVQQCCGLVGHGRIGARQRALDQIAPGRHAVGQHRLRVLPLLLDLALEQPARAECKQQQHRHHREVDAQRERFHSELSVSCFLANT